MTQLNNLKSEDWTVEKLKSLSGEECLKLFKSLPPPDFEELNGEYAATLLGEPSEFGDWLMYKTELGNWQGKAYTPTTSAERPGFRSEGYNFWIIDEKKIYHSRFATHMGISQIDGKSVFRMQYNAFKSLYGQQGMVDEIRKLKTGLYMCYGWQWPDRDGGPFCLAGPQETYNKDHEWYFGDEVSEPVKIKYSFKDFPDPNIINTPEFREMFKEHFD